MVYLIGTTLSVIGFIWAITVIIWAAMELWDLIDEVIRKYKYSRTPAGRLKMLISEQKRTLKALRRYHVGGFIKEHTK